MNQLLEIQDYTDGDRSRHFEYIAAFVDLINSTERVDKAIQLFKNCSKITLNELKLIFIFIREYFIRKSKRQQLDSLTFPVFLEDSKFKKFDISSSKLRKGEVSAILVEFFVEVKSCWSTINIEKATSLITNKNVSKSNLNSNMGDNVNSENPTQPTNENPELNQGSSNQNRNSETTAEQISGTQELTALMIKMNARLDTLENSKEIPKKKKKNKKSGTMKKIKRSRKRLKMAKKKGSKRYYSSSSDTTSDDLTSESDDSTSGDFSSDESKSDDECMFSKKNLVSRKLHGWLAYSLSLNNNKLAKISELKCIEIENFLLAFIQENFKNAKACKKVAAYISLCYQLSSVRVLERYTETSMNHVAQNSVNTVDNWIFRKENTSANRIEQLVNSNSFKFSEAKQSAGNFLKKEKKQFVRLCNVYNSNKNCSSDCRYTHACKFCYQKNRDQLPHMPKDCPKKCRTSSAN